VGAQSSILGVFFQPFCLQRSVSLHPFCDADEFLGSMGVDLSLGVWPVDSYMVWSFLVCMCCLFCFCEVIVGFGFVLIVGLIF
jgi:hypothetical protein